MSIVKFYVQKEIFQNLHLFVAHVICKKKRFVANICTHHEENIFEMDCKCHNHCNDATISLRVHASGHISDDPTHFTNDMSFNNCMLCFD